MERTAHHPFRTAEAQAEFFADYDRRAARWPVPSEARMVETSWARTFVRLSGPAAAPPLVLLHGMGTNGLGWEPNIEALAAGFRTYAVDSPYDIGRSVYTRDARSADDLVSWLDELFTALGLTDKINLAGMSYGGWMTSRYALRHPDRLARAVLLVPALTVLNVKWLWVARCLLSTLHPRLSRSFMSWTLHDAMNKSEYCRSRAEEVSHDGFLCANVLVKRSVVLPKRLTDDEWRSLRVPTLILVGEHEKHYSAPRAVRRIGGIAPQVRIEMIADAGHDLTVVQAELVNQKVVAFLSE